MLKIIISPAKKMNLIEEYPCELTTPVFLDRALDLHERLKKMTLAELTALWGCSDKLAAQNHERLHTYSPERALSPALLSYEGIQYQHIAPGVFTDAQWNYVNSHLRILSGFYGILAPTDTVVPYRLEMQAKLKTENDVDLYGYWGNALYEELVRDGMTELVNLASGEYSKAILPYIKVAPAPSRNGSQTHDSSPSSETCPPCIPCITCIFGELVNDKVKMKGTQAKIARGEMVRWMAEKGIEKAEDIREFKELGYRFRSDLSSLEEYVFLLTPKTKALH